MGMLLRSRGQLTRGASEMARCRCQASGMFSLRAPAHATMRTSSEEIGSVFSVNTADSTTSRAALRAPWCNRASSSSPTSRSSPPSRSSCRPIATPRYASRAVSTSRLHSCWRSTPDELLQHQLERDPPTRKWHRTGTSELRLAAARRAPVQRQLRVKGGLAIGSHCAPAGTRTRCPAEWP